MKNIFKKQSRADEVEEFVEGITSNIISNAFTPSEILEMHEKITYKLVFHLENEKSRLLIESKKSTSNYKAASYALTALRNSKEILQDKPNN